MKHLKIAFGLAVVAGLMAVVASPAMALGPRWVTCVPEPLKKGHWEDNKCTKPAPANGEWETAEIASTVEVTSSGALKLKDSAATGGAVTIECEGTNQGTVGKEGQGSITRISASHCKFLNSEHGSCEEAAEPTARAVNLGWSTHLEERKNTVSGEIELRNLIRSLSTKPPGWSVECRVGGIFKVTDECTGGTSTAVRSNRATGATEFIFDTVSAQEPASCTLGNSTSGTVLGTVFSRLRTSTGELRPLWVLSSVEKT
jgi:hypothetical protein